GGRQLCDQLRLLVGAGAQAESRRYGNLPPPTGPRKEIPRLRTVPPRSTRCAPDQRTGACPPSLEITQRHPQRGEHHATHHDDQVGGGSVFDVDVWHRAESTWP